PSSLAPKPASAGLMARRGRNACNSWVLNPSQIHYDDSRAPNVPSHAPQLPSRGAMSQQLIQLQAARRMLAQSCRRPVVIGPSAIAIAPSLAMAVATRLPPCPDHKADRVASVALVTDSPGAEVDVC